MAEVRPLYFDTTNGYAGPTQSTNTDTVTWAGITITSGGDLTVSGGGTVTGLPTVASGSTDAVSKAYADQLISNLPPKEACRVATTTGWGTSWTASGSGVGKTLTAPDNSTTYNDFDSVTVALVDRVLVKNATSGVDNGIYYVTALGNGVDTSTELTRATDFDENTEVVAGSRTWIAEGTSQADTYWAVTTDDDITVDTTSIAWTQFGGPGSFTGGNGIDISGTVVSVDLATNSGLEISSEKLQVDAYNGITRDANGISVTGGNGISVDGSGVHVDAGDGLTVTGGDLDVELSATPGLEFDSGDLQAKVNASKAMLREAAGLGVNVDGSTITINGSNQLEASAASSAIRVTEELTAQEALANGDVVEWGTTNDRIRECQGSVGARVDAFGIVEESGGIASEGTGTIVRSGIAADVLSGASVGDRYFCGRVGGIVQGTSSFQAGDHIVFVGTAVNATDLEVRIQYVTQI